MIAARPGARFVTVLAALAALLLLAGCGWNAPGPRVTIYNEDPNAAPGAGGEQQADPETVSVSNNGRHIVRKGETLYAISRAYKVPIRTLIVENELRPPYELVVGQRLRVPQTDVHLVMKGDTLYSVSRQYGVSASELARLNGIQPPYTIKIGQRLAIPGQVTGSLAAKLSGDTEEEEDDRRGGSTIQSADLPPPGGETGTSSAAGDGLVGDVTVVEPTAPTAAKPSASIDPTRRETFAYADNGLPLPPDRPRPPVRFVTNIPQPPAIEAGGFTWPVRGRVIASYGSKGRGLYNDGLNIAAPRGAPVRAAQAGVVAYSGEELAGFGKMVLIKHADGHLTAYAHNGELLVSRGDRIRRGQTIARVGSTGDVDTPQLHFQVRKGRQTLDPMGFLRG